MVKRCAYGKCDTDSRYPERLLGGVQFHPFPKPGRNLDACRRWLRLCGRPHSDLNETILRDHGKAKHVYVCSKLSSKLSTWIRAEEEFRMISERRKSPSAPHFVDGRPTKDNPDPEPATRYDEVTPARKPPKPRAMSEPAKKRKKLGDLMNETNNRESLVVLQHDENVENNQNVCNVSQSTCAEPANSPADDISGPSALNVLALAAENRELTDKVLSQAAENDALRQQVARLVLLNEDCIRKGKQAPTRMHTRQSLILSMNFSASFLRQLNKTKKKDEFTYYTGLTQEQFTYFYNFLVPARVRDLPLKMNRTVGAQKYLTLEDQVLLVMIKLRQNFDFDHIGNLYGISQQDASTLFGNWINYMFFRCSSVSMWPHRDKIIEMMPPKFREKYPNTLVILDGVEFKFQKPSSLTRQSQTYSDYKSDNTLKAVVGIEPRGGITYASMLFSGNISDKELTKRSGFFDLVEDLMGEGKLVEGDGVMVDKGFHIEDELKAVGLRINIPPFAKSGQQMSSSDIHMTETVAQHRVHVERAIRRTKVYKIMKEKVDISLFSKINQIWFVVAFSTNFMNFLIKLCMCEQK